MKPSKSPEIATNRKARHDFIIGDKCEAGLALVGSEVKSIRAGQVNIRDAFARIEKGQAFLYGCDIQPYQAAGIYQHEPKRPRRLLLHRKEIRKLEAEINQRGSTLVVLRLYWKGQKVKAEIGVAKGKAHADRRQALREHTEKREADRAMAAFNRRSR
jgi:SsrA-binding protein